jgi:ComF family protein
MPNFIKIKEAALDLLFPELCLNCRRYLDNPDEKENLLCRQCLGSIIVNRQVFRNPGFFLGAATFYRIDAVRNLVHFLKYEDFPAISRPIGKIISQYLQQSAFRSLFSKSQKTMEIIPIPLHPLKLMRRGFNQSEDIAKILSARTDWPINNKILRRVKNTKPQAGLSKKTDRIKNLSESFDVERDMKNYVAGKTFIVIDDVYTSGATMSEAIKTLKSNGAKKVAGFVFAKS